MKSVSSVNLKSHVVMIRIHRSNKLTNLAKKLADDLNKHSPNDPLTTLEIVVPNRDTARWLKLFLAEENGILANISFILPAEWQFRLIRTLYPNLPKVLPGDPQPLSWAVFNVLMDDTTRKQFPRPDRYVNAQPEETKEQAVMQLSKKIASVYDQYLVYRPELILKWQKSVSTDDTHEKWQAEMWNYLEKNRLIREKGRGFPNKAVLIRETIKALKGGDIKPEQTLLFFNPGLLPLPVLQMAGHASEHQDLLIYQTAVAENMKVVQENNLLRAFGEEAMGIELLFENLDGEINQEFVVKSSADHLLHSIQASITQNRELYSFKSGALSGVEVHSCHTQLREIEVLYQFLLRQFEGDDELNPDDVLVVMPDVDTYKPFIHAVFGTDREETPSIPYHVDFMRSSGEDLSRPFLQLLELADSRFRFPDVIDFFAEPAVRDAFGVSESDMRRLKRWLEENNVIWGLDSDQRSGEDQPAEKAQTWQAALWRGWSGVLYGEQDDPFEDGTSLRFSTIRGQDREEAWAGFSNFIRRFQSLNNSCKMKRTPSAWFDEFERQMDCFFSAESLDSDSSSRVRAALDSVRNEIEAAGFDREISFSLIRSHIRKSLELQSASAANFTRGVTFSSMVPVRSIPAKIVALIGLNEGEFPRKPKNIDFDLMAQHPRPIERNPKNQDRSLFLESILAAEKVHYCSYIGRSRVDNETIPPSPIISEWLETLSRITGRKPEEILTEEPLHGFSAENFRLNRSYSKTGHQAARSLLLGNAEDTGLKLMGQLPSNDTSNQLNVSGLTRFISNPLRSFFKEQFNPVLNDPEELKDEFSLNALEKHQIFERIFSWRLQGRSYQKIVQLLGTTGVVPAGWQGEFMVLDLSQAADEAIKSATERDYEPLVTVIDIELKLGEMKLEGEITSYTSTRFLDITASGGRGDKFLNSWVKHLIVQKADIFAEQESMFVCDLKKGNPSWYKFTTVEDPESELRRFTDLYRRGIREPLPVFPNASFEYEKADFRGKDDGLFKAKAEFEGSDFSPYSENKDVYVKLYLGENAKFSDAYLNPELQNGIRVMLEHMEKLK